MAKMKKELEKLFNYKIHRDKKKRINEPGIKQIRELIYLIDKMQRINKLTILN